VMGGATEHDLVSTAFRDTDAVPLEVRDEKAEPGMTKLGGGWNRR